jgi:hypothetical protein
MYRKMTLSFITVAGFYFPAKAVNITGKVTGTECKY